MTTTTYSFSFDENLYSDFHKDVYGFRPSQDDKFYTTQSLNVGCLLTCLWLFELILGAIPPNVTI